MWVNLIASNSSMMLSREVSMWHVSWHGGTLLTLPTSGVGEIVWSTFLEVDLNRLR